jgi:hypothetical protein
MVRQFSKAAATSDESLSDYEKTLKRALADRDAVAEQRSDLDARYADLTALARSLLPLVSPERRAFYTKQLEPEPPQSSGRATENFANIVQLIALENRREWTAPAMQEALKLRNIEADLKPIHNVFNYLAREGRIRRISRGRYYVPEYAVGIITSDDLLGDGE